MATEPLSLSTDSDVDHVAIDGRQYPLADPGGFSTVQSVALRRRAKELASAQGNEDLSEEQAARVDQALDEIFATVAPSVPAELAQKLTPRKKAQVVEFFLQRAAARHGATARNTTSHSSAASSASTEATPAHG